MNDFDFFFWVRDGHKKIENWRELDNRTTGRELSQGGRDCTLDLNSKVTTKHKHVSNIHQYEQLLYHENTENN